MILAIKPLWSSVILPKIFQNSSVILPIIFSGFLRDPSHRPFVIFCDPADNLFRIPPWCNSMFPVTFHDPAHLILQCAPTCDTDGMGRPSCSTGWWHILCHFARHQPGGAKCNDQVGQEPDTIISTLATPYDDFFVIRTQASTESSAKLAVAFFNNNALSAMLYAPELTDHNVLSTLPVVSTMSGRMPAPEREYGSLKEVEPNRQQQQKRHMDNLVPIM